jgi:hypothetical protein
LVLTCFGITQGFGHDDVMVCGCATSRTAMGETRAMVTIRIDIYPEEAAFAESSAESW